MYDERLTAPATWWLYSVITGLFVGLTLFYFGLVIAFIGFVAGTAAAAVLISSYGSVRVRVVQGALVAGDAKVPVSALGEAHVMDAEEARAWRLHKADTRAFMLLRAYIPTAVRIEVTDPEDPTPYLYLSTRFPKRLVSALDKARSAEPSPSGS
ncbi:DUF3093 domain-containing protein [Mangrovactinospora gilvigrisea]|uniref:DUF3093 domain-containing protein n=1 Tax=Mangrovactinospora gilvigrisea TaxID=1428644 RepID=UPI0008FC7A3F|nr:DUF3093 domain-containing protein [Mangrovactinospora gilvigrisea]